MSALAPVGNHIPAMTAEALAEVRAMEDFLLTLPQLRIDTQHLIHAGLYARTICVPAGSVVSGALVDVPTVLIVSGHCKIYTGQETLEVQGFQVLPGSPGRKQIVVAMSDTHFTMCFATPAKTVSEAESEFTSEAHRLMSRNGDCANHIHFLEG